MLLYIQADMMLVKGDWHIDPGHRTTLWWSFQQVMLEQSVIHMRERTWTFISWKNELNWIKLHSFFFFFLQENIGSTSRPLSSCFSQREMLINSFLSVVAAVARVVSVWLPRKCRRKCGFPLLLVLSPTGSLFQAFWIEVSSLRPFSVCNDSGLSLPAIWTGRCGRKVKRFAAIWDALWDLIFIQCVCSCLLIRVSRYCATCSLQEFL